MRLVQAKEVQPLNYVVINHRCVQVIDVILHGSGTTIFYYDPYPRSHQSFIVPSDCYLKKENINANSLE